MRSFRDISISYKTLVPPIIMMIALGSVLLVTARGFDKQDGVIRRVNEIALERSTLLNRFILLSERVQSDLFLVSVMRFMEVPDGEVVPVHNQLEEGLSNLGFIYHQILNEWSLDATEKETLKQMKTPLDGFRKQARQATDAVLKNPSFGLLLVRSAAFPFAQFRKLLTKFLDYQKDKIVQAETAARQTAGNVKTTTLIISIAMALISILLTALIGNRFISRPVRDITAMMGRLAQGDLSVDIKERGRGDEIGSIAKAVEVFRENAIEKRRAEKELRDREERFRITAEETRQLMYSFDPKTGKVKWAGAVEAVTGYTYEEYQSFDVDAWAEHIHPDDREMALKAMDEAVEHHTRYDTEYRFRRKDGSYIFVEEHGAFVTGRESAPYPTVGIISNITERKLAEEQIKASLEEKEVLLREIHHRVKNNMQVITSLLRLQSDKIKDPQYVEMLKESQTRIKAMALIHEKLYRSKDLARVDFNEYIKSLINGLFRSHGIDTSRIRTKLKIEDVSLGLDHAIPCGLIINELVSNSLKYAFPGDRKGEISVTLRSITEDEIELRVSDDGIGIPEDLDFRNTDSLGLDLVTILAEDQLEGKIDLDRIGGTTFRILFKGKI